MIMMWLLVSFLLLAGSRKLVEHMMGWRACNKIPDRKGEVLCSGLGVLRMTESFAISRLEKSRKRGSNRGTAMNNC